MKPKAVFFASGNIPDKSFAHKPGKKQNFRKRTKDENKRLGGKKDLGKYLSIIGLLNRKRRR